MGAIAALSLYSARQAARRSATEQLTVLQTENAQQVQTYFQTLQSHTVTLAADRMVVMAMVELNKEFLQLDRKFIPAEWDEPLQAYYEASFLPQLTALSGEEVRFGSYGPSGQAARYLQHYYLSLNEFEPAEKNLLIAADDGSEYSRYHGQYHPSLNDIVQQFGYSDLYLVNHKTEDIVYSVNKAPDFGTNLDDGPYRESNFAELIATVRENEAQGTVAIADYSTYDAAGGQPALFVASPIYNGPYVVGILALRVNTDPIKHMMASPERPQSLDSYLVGADQRLRSTPRFFEDDPERYVRLIRRQGIGEDTLQAIERFEAPMLLQSVDTPAVTAALGGEAATGREQDYRGMPVLTAYAPLEIDGLNWAIVSQINAREAFAAVTQLQLLLLVAATVIVVALTFLAMMAATLTIQPIRRLNEWADQVVDGDFDLDLDLSAEDEVGQLADTLQIMVTSLSHQVATLDQKMAQNKVLLANLVPPAIVKRLKRGETVIADRVKQVTIVYASLVGIAELSQSTPAEQVAELLTRLMKAFDEAAERHAVERQRTASTDYLAICGLTVPKLDHIKRAVDFALEMVQILSRPEFGQEFALGVRLAVHTGPVTAGVVGTERFGYSVWGESIYIATRLYAQAALNTVVLTQAAYEGIADTYTCIPAGAVIVEKVGAVETWMLASRDRMAIRQVDLVQQSFAKVRPQSEPVGKLFYSRLFALRPDFRPLFHAATMAEQERKLMSTLAIAVDGLSNPSQVIPIAQELGRRHQGYGVEADFYEDVGAALLWTLEQGLKDDFTPEVRQAWEAAYSFLSNVMINAAAQSEPENIGV